MKYSFYYSSYDRMAFMVILSFLLFTSCKSSSPQIPEDNNNDDEEIVVDEELLELPIRDIVSKLYPENVYVGVANKADLIGELSTEIADREFSYVTPANDFKQSYVVADLNKKPRWEKPDKYLAHAQEVGQVLRIHGPISPQCSPWAREDNRTKDEMSRMLNLYMQALCQRYNGKEGVLWMDVVNETICPENVKGGKKYPDMIPGDWFGPRDGTDKWENPWTILGYDEESELKVPLYIDMAFEIANKYAPNIKQIINQHGRFEEVVWEKMKELVNYLREEKGRRVDGLGWQAHIDMGWEKEEGNLERLDAFIKWCHANDLEFHVTEMNVWMKDVVDEDAQADTFGKVLEVLLKNRETGVVGINYWNVRDEDTSNAEWQGTIWRNDGTPRKAYERIKKELIMNY